MKSVIYETAGRAKEFNELALNLYSGCPHGCLYCYAPAVLHVDRATFHSNAAPRLEPADLEIGLTRMAALKGENVLLCFTCDPYPPGDNTPTRYAIQKLHEHGFKVTILTKGSQRSVRDLDLLGPGDQYATTLTLLSPAASQRWEPGAALPYERVAALKAAHWLGIETWVSLEPVIDPEATRLLVELTHDFVGHYKVGMLNYHPHGKTINWVKFGLGMKELLDSLGAKYYFKDDLVKAMGLRPGTFPQTYQVIENRYEEAAQHRHRGGGGPDH